MHKLSHGLWSWRLKLRLKQGLPLLLREAGGWESFLIAYSALSCIKAPAIHASTMRDETGQYMLWYLLLGGKGWDVHTRDQTVDLSSFYFSDTMHIYESSLGFPNWKKKYIYLKASIWYSAAAACSTKDASARPRAELQTIVKTLLFGYCNYLQELKSTQYFVDPITLWVSFYKMNLERNWISLKPRKLMEK